MTDYDPRIVDLYDEDNPDGPDHDFYRSLADDRHVRSILDLGCGTGILTVTLAAPGRRVVGLDPSATMIAFARARAGAERVDWIVGDSSAAPDEDFDLAVMSGNVVQHIPDADWRRTLHDLRGRLSPGGAVAFESRNPLARAWRTWGSDDSSSRTTSHGTLIEWTDVEVIDERIIRLRAHNLFEATADTVTLTEDLVFRSRAEIERDLDAAGFIVDTVAGDWFGTPFDDSARLMVFVAHVNS